MQSKLLVLFLVLTALSQSISVEVPPSACDSEGDLILAITNLPQCLAETILMALTEGLVFAAEQFYGLSIGFLTASPDIRWFCSPYNAIMAIIESFYTVMLMALGAYYIINSSDVEGRTKAKIWLKNVFYMVILLSFAFPIFEMILDLNTQISSTIYDSVSDSIFEVDASLSNLIFALVFAVSLSTGSYLTFLTLLIRYLLIPFLLFFFPITIFFYFTPPLRAWGAFLFKFSMLIIFMTSADAILLLGISYLFDSPDPNLAGALVQSFGLMIGFGLIGLLNLVIFIIATLSIILIAIKTLETAVAMLMRLAIILTFL